MKPRVLACNTKQTCVLFRKEQCGSCHGISWGTASVRVWVVSVVLVCCCSWLPDTGNDYELLRRTGRTFTGSGKNLYGWRKELIRVTERTSTGGGKNLYG